MTTPILITTPVLHAIFLTKAEATQALATQQKWSEIEGHYVVGTIEKLGENKFKLSYEIRSCYQNETPTQTVRKVP